MGLAELESWWTWRAGGPGADPGGPDGPGASEDLELVFFDAFQNVCEVQRIFGG